MLLEMIEDFYYVVISIVETIVEKIDLKFLRFEFIKRQFNK